MTFTRSAMIVSKVSVTPGAKALINCPPFAARLKRLRKNSPLGRKAVPQGLKPDVFPITYGTTKVVP